MSAIDILADDMVESGLGRLFGIPGSGASLELIDALEARGIPFHTTYSEGAAAIMAGVTGRLSGRAGAALAIKGPGLANMVAGLATCHLEAWPMVALAEAYAPDAPAAKSHKRLDHGALIGAVAKGRRFLAGEGSGFPDMARWSLAEAPGPVVLELAGASVGAQQPVPDIEVSPGEPIVALVARAERPVVIAGGLAIREAWAARLNRLGVPVFTTVAAKGVVDETLPHAAGVYTGVGLARAPEHTILPKADLVIGLGLRSNEVLDARPFACDAINIDPLGRSRAAGFEFAATGGVGDVDAVFDKLDGASWGLDELARTRAELRRCMIDGRFLPAHVFDAVARRFDGRVRMVFDTGYFCTIGEHIWAARQASWCLASGQGRSMGVAIPMALAAALEDPAVPTVVALGDGGIGMYVAELKLAVSRKLPLLVLLMSDGGFGSIRDRAVTDGLSQSALVMAEPSWVAAARGLGLAAERAEDGAAVEAVLAAWKPESGPLFVELPFDPEAYRRMVRGIR